MTGGNLEVAYLFIQMAAAAVLLIVCGLLVCKGVNAYGHRKRLKCEEKHRAYFIRIQNGLDQDGALPKPERKLNRVERTVVQAKLMAWIDRVDGLSREKLIALCEELGFVDRELIRLQSRFSVRKSKAAYRLGMMRSKLAAPALLEEFRKQPFGPSLFIFARSLALCARGSDDLETMVLQIVKHRRPVHEITASILEEADGDFSELLELLLLNGNPDSKRIALLCLDKAAAMREASLGNVLVFRESTVKGERKRTTRAI